MRGEYREKIFQRYQSVDSRSRQGKVLVADEPGCLDFRQTGKGWILADVTLRDLALTGCHPRNRLAARGKKGNNEKQ